MLTSLILYFAVAGFMGWIYETAAMTLYEGKWDNRGFLSGPFLPIYAVGCVGCLLVFSFLIPGCSKMQVFLIGVFGSVVLEFLTSLVLEKIFHTVWWDYSICPGNIQGRVCPPASLGFGVAALVVVFVINPHLWPLITLIPARFGKLVAVCWVLLFLTDLVHSILRLKFGQEDFRVMEALNDRMDRFVDHHLPIEKSLCERIHEHIDKSAAEPAGSSAAVCFSDRTDEPDTGFTGADAAYPGDRVTGCGNADAGAVPSAGHES